jgi:formylmethanofuran--tetrahydromethanopterin N-formyltransferase
MRLNGVLIQDTFAEAWDLAVVRLALTAISEEIALGAAGQFVGAAGSSELGSRINAGIERVALPHETPDGRPGVFVALTMPPARRDEMVKELALRVVLATLAPTCAVFDAMPASVKERQTIDLYAETAGRWQGYDEAGEIGGRPVCIVPTTTGRFVYERSVTLSLEGTDGHIVCYAENEASAVLSVGAAKSALAGVDGVCPMGMGLEQVFRELDYVPALRERVPNSRVPAGVGSLLNLLMFGASEALMRQGMRVAVEAACRVAGVVQIGAMNFGGQFGRHQYHLRELVSNTERVVL